MSSTPYIPFVHPHTNTIGGIVYDVFDLDAICEEFKRLKLAEAESYRDNKVDKESKEDTKKKPSALPGGSIIPCLAFGLGAVSRN